MNLRRAITALLAVLGIAFACSSPASAGGLYFGINLELVGGPQREPFISGFSILPLPFPGAQIGYDFGEGTSGFGARLSFNYFIFGQLALDGYYRLGMDQSGDSAYFGGGAEYQFVAFDTITNFYGLHALIGYEWRLTTNLAVFLEATPGILFWTGGPSFAVALRSGLLLRF